MTTRNSYVGLGEVPDGVGAILRGWDFRCEEEFRDPERLNVIDFRAMTERCEHNCPGCFARRKKTISLDQIRSVIDQAAALGCRGINFNGEGEPTLDEDFWKIIEHTWRSGIVPILFTAAAKTLCDRDFLYELYHKGVSVVPKCDSLFNERYQNKVLGNGATDYFAERAEALKALMEREFNDKYSNVTRLGFDMLVTRQNIHEVPRTLSYCRDRGIWVVFSTHLPAGRSASPEFLFQHRPTPEQMVLMREEITRVDRRYVMWRSNQEIPWEHPVYRNFGPYRCVERMQILGDGLVTPCPGNETIIGDIRTDSLAELNRRIIEQFPCHDPRIFDGNCLYRSS